MQPTELVKAEERLKTAHRKAIQKFCAAAEFEVTLPEYDYEEGKLKSEGIVAVKNTACENLRRHGSKWCQECSDAHHAKKANH